VNNQDEIISSYIKKLEEENRELKVKAKARRPFYLFERGWEASEIIFSGLMASIILFIGYIAFQAMHNGKHTGNFYVKKYNYNKVCIHHEYDWGQDDILDCYGSLEEAHKFLNISKQEWLKMENINDCHSNESVERDSAP